MNKLNSLKPHQTFQKFSFFFLALIFGILTISCSEDSQKGSKGGAGKFGGKGKKPVSIIPVEVVKPNIGLAASYYVTTATLEPSSDAKINSRTVGVVKQILHEEGDDVVAGDVLLILEDDDQQLRLKQAKQKLLSTKREFNRLNKMKSSGAVSSTDWDAAEIAYQLSITEKELAELTLSYTKVTAPFNGRVVKREVDLGAYVGQSELLYRMMAINPLLVRVHIPANRLGMVTKGQSVQLNIDGLSKEMNAFVDLVSPIVDPTTGTIKITLRLEQYPKSIRPGDFTEVHMVTEQHQNAILVPSISIIEERGNNFLYTVVDGKAQRQSVTVGFIMSEQTEIIEGITAADDVVFKGQRNLNNDVAVEILSSDSQNVMANKSANKVEGKKKGRKNKTREDK
ncbi:MAG: membrane fusion protein (multidrug efflux system) [Polaribacter sp.]|jgi:membrane fusion protein (multidrug efflux system)